MSHRSREHPLSQTISALISNGKTPYSIFKSLEKAYGGAASFEEALECLRSGLKEELRRQFGVKDLSQAEQILEITFILAGYEEGDVSRPLLCTTVIYSGKPPIPGLTTFSGHHTSWKNSATDRFGCCWIGRGEFVAHVVNHSNAALPPIAGQYALMTLADAEDYVRFLAEYTCNFQRFAVMVPDCGHPVVTAVLTPDGYKERIAGDA
ncbi:MAG: hypothetical protein ACHQPI_12325 [Thermoanaerobaculia bacterium]